MYVQVNRNILRVTPANVLAALLVIAAGLVEHGPVVYVLWTAALLIPIAMPYVVPAGGRFVIRPGHIVERHGLLVRVVAAVVAVCVIPLGGWTALAELLALLGGGPSCAGRRPDDVCAVVWQAVEEDGCPLVVAVFTAGRGIGGAFFDSVFLLEMSLWEVLG